MSRFELVQHGLNIQITTEEIVNVFHCLFYANESAHSGPTKKYMGVPIHKNPGDMFNYQQIIYNQKPDFIIECGAFQGGSTLFFAHTLDLIGKGKVISVDICERDESWYPQVREHDRAILITGSSTDKAIIEQIRELTAGSMSNFVILDSLHTKAHVLDEMKLYNEFLFSGNYMIVEDGNLNGHPLPPAWHSQTAREGGPFEAIQEFMQKNNEYSRDHEYEKRFLFSYAPSGYLRKR
jgi:cephalosporin hydroxylase